MNDKVIAVLLIILFGLAYFATSESRSLTDEQVIAQCKKIANDKTNTLDIPMRAGAIDSSGWPTYHPCKFEYFESACRETLYKLTYNNCLTTLKGR